MQTNPESAAAEAVAWQARINEGHEWQSISEEAYKSITGWDKRALYPQSALDALRGEVAAAERRVAECLPYLRTFLSQCEKEHTARCDEAGLRELIAALTKVTP